MLFDECDPKKNELAGNHVREAKQVPWQTRLGNVAGHSGGQKGSRIIVGKAGSGHTQARLKLCSGFAQACSLSAQVKAAAAHVQTLKRNQRKKELT